MSKNVVNNFLNDFKIFLESNSKNIWLISDDYRIYVRKSKRLFNGCFYDCIDLVNINIENKGKKYFLKFWKISCKIIKILIYLWNQ